MVAGEQMRLYPSEDGTAALAIRRKNRLKKPQPKDFRTLREYFNALEARKRSRRSDDQKPAQVRYSKKKNDSPLETVEQANLFEWVLTYERQIPALKHFFAIPNQGVARLKRLQMEGTRAGVFDTFLSYPVAPYHGLYIEMKRIKGGKVSTEQIEFYDRMVAVGYSCHVCRGAEEAWLRILEYLKIKDPRRG